MPGNECPSIWYIDLGGLNSVAIWTIRQIILACWQSKNKCLIVSLQSQKQHFVLLVQFLFAKLSLVKITPRWRYQMKIFIFSRILSFQINLFRNRVHWFIRNSYIDWTMKWLCLCKFQVKVSLPFESCWPEILATRLCQAINLSPTRALRKETFNGVWCITFGNVSCG